MENFHKNFLVKFRLGKRIVRFNFFIERDYYECPFSLLRIDICRKVYDEIFIFQIGVEFWTLGIGLYWYDRELCEKVYPYSLYNDEVPF